MARYGMLAGMRTMLIQTVNPCIDLKKHRFPCSGSQYDLSDNQIILYEYLTFDFQSAWSSNQLMPRRAEHLIQENISNCA